MVKIRCWNCGGRCNKCGRTPGFCDQDCYNRYYEKLNTKMRRKNDKKNKEV